jgi:hypothetical protein
MENKYSQELHACNIGIIKGLEDFRQRVEEEELAPEFE